MSNATLFVDLSSNQPLPDLPKHYKAGYRVLALKATEGTGYTWQAHAELAREWHRLGGSVWHYHFARPGSGVTQADYFLGAVAPVLKPGDRFVIDCEVGGVTGRLVTAFINRCHAKHPDVAGVIYGGPYFLRDNGIKPAHGWGLWLAEYGPRISFIPPGWSSALAWQFTDHAKSKGIGYSDVSKLLGAIDPPPKPKPVKKQHLGNAFLAAARFVIWRLHKAQNLDAASTHLLDRLDAATKGARK